MARFSKGERPAGLETMEAYKKCIVDVAEREAFIELSKLLCATHPEEQQLSQASLSDALGTTEKLLQQSVTAHLWEVSVGIIPPVYQVQQLAEHLATMATDFVEGRHPPNRPGPNGLAEVLLHGEGDDDARASYVVIHTPIADHLEYASER